MQHVAVNTMPNFPSCTYCPSQLRPLLRFLHARDERVVAWGVTQPVVSASTQILGAAVALIPVVGICLHPAIVRTGARLLVLTDRRLLLLGTTGSLPLDPERLVVADEPIEGVRVRRRRGKRAYDLTLTDSRKSLRIVLADHKLPMTGRLDDALGLLAEPGAARGEGHPEPGTAGAAPGYGRV